MGAAAAFLQVTPLLEQVSTAMASNLTACNCVSAWLFAIKFSFDGLAMLCRTKAVESFEELGADIFKLPLLEMRELLAADQLNIGKESTVLDVAVRYARANSLTSGVELASLFSNVRFTLLSENVFKDVVMNEPLLGGIECREMLLRAYAATKYCREETWRGTAALSQATSARDMPGSMSIIVTNIPRHLRAREIIKCFEAECGSTTKFELERGTAYITFKHAGNAQRAKAMFDGGEVNGNIISVSIG